MFSRLLSVRVSQALILRHSYYTQVKIEDFQFLSEFLGSVVRESVSRNIKIKWADLTPKLLHSLPLFEKRSPVLRPANVDTFVTMVLMSKAEGKALLEYTNHVQEEGRTFSLKCCENILIGWLRSTEEFSQHERSQICQKCDQILESHGKHSEILWQIIGLYAKFGDSHQARAILSGFDLNNLRNIHVLPMKYLLLLCIKENDLDLFWHLMDSGWQTQVVGFKNDGVSMSIQAQEEIFDVFIRKYYHDPKLLERLFKYFQENLYFIPNLVEDALFDVANDKCVVTDRRALCYNCKEKLPPAHITKDNCQFIKDSLTQHALTGDMYKKSFPKEYDNFKEFLDRNKNTKYDMVIDGLNLCGGKFFRKGQSMDRKHMDAFLFDTIHRLKNEFGMKSICLIHRTWLVKSNMFQKIRDLCTSVHLLDKHSDDDPFSIIAALHFGPGTFLCSNDLYKQYLALFKDSKSKNMFLRWQMHHVVNHHTSVKRDTHVRFQVNH